MKRYKLFPVLRHAVMMVGRTLKSYALLSVTIVLSFSLLLGYLVYTDSAIYNENKLLFSYRRGDVTLFVRDQDSEKLQLLLENLNAMEHTGHYVYYRYSLGWHTTSYQLLADVQKDPERINHMLIWADLMPDYAWPDGSNYREFEKTLQIVWLDGQDHEKFVLEKNQVILSEAMYRTLGLEGQTNPTFLLNIEDGQKILLEVVGYFTNQSYERWLSFGMGKNSKWYADMILSTKFHDYAQLDNTELYESHSPPGLMETCVQIYSETPEEVVKLLETMGYTRYWAVYQDQNAVLEGIRQEKENKAIITCALLLLLGINLYSSFSNALNDRKFEIGVKRAIGASAFSIVRQFLYESMLVMCANTFLSVGLVADVAIIYKYVVEHTYDELGNPGDFILYVSPYSIGMFATCAVTLTVVFSLIFAYKSTRVEIVQYLKSE